MPHDMQRVDPAMLLGRRAFLGGSAGSTGTEAARPSRAKSEASAAVEAAVALPPRKARRPRGMAGSTRAMSCGMAVTLS